MMPVISKIWYSLVSQTQTKTSVFKKDSHVIKIATAATLLHVTYSDTL